MDELKRMRLELTEQRHDITALIILLESLYQMQFAQFADGAARFAELTKTSMKSLDGVAATAKTETVDAAVLGITNSLLRMTNSIAAKIASRRPAEPSGQ